MYFFETNLWPFLEKTYLRLLSSIKLLNTFEKWTESLLLTRNPFTDIGSPQGEIGVNLPNNYKFTGIAQVGDKKGVMVSTPIGLEIFYVGQQISKDFKITMINSKKAEVILSNGLNKILVKLEKE